MARCRWSEQQMRELLQEHEESGLSLKAFAAAAAVPHSTMSWWRAKLRSGGGSPRFVPVAAAEPGPAAVEIAVGDIVVRVRGGDERAVARLVRAIAAC